jgi:hypothetical protein
MTVTIATIVTGPRKSWLSMVTIIATLVTIAPTRTTNRHQEKASGYEGFGRGDDGDEGLQGARLRARDNKVRFQKGGFTVL